MHRKQLFHTFFHVKMIEKYYFCKHIIFNLITDTENPGMNFIYPWTNGSVKWSGIPNSGTPLYNIRSQNFVEVHETNCTPFYFVLNHFEKIIFYTIKRSKMALLGRWESVQTIFVCKGRLCDGDWSLPVLWLYLGLVWAHDILWLYSLVDKGLSD